MTSQTPRTRFGRAIPLVLAVLAIASTASATVMVEVPLDEMIRRADAIVHATVERSGVRMAIGGGSMVPETITTLRVHEWIAGPGGETVELRELGGVWQGGGLRYDGTPTYAPGEEVILFLERREEAPQDLRTFAMVQGKFTVMHGVPGVPSSVRRALAGIAFLRWADGQQSVSPPGRESAMELQTFLDHVRRVRAEGVAR